MRFVSYPSCFGSAALSVVAANEIRQALILKVKRLLGSVHKLRNTPNGWGQEVRVTCILGTVPNRKALRNGWAGQKNRDFRVT